MVSLRLSQSPCGSYKSRAKLCTFFTLTHNARLKTFNILQLSSNLKYYTLLENNKTTLQNSPQVRVYLCNALGVSLLSLSRNFDV